MGDSSVLGVRGNLLVGHFASARAAIGESYQDRVNVCPYYQVWTK